MLKVFVPLRGLAQGVRQQWHERDVPGALRPLFSGMPPPTGDPEIDAIIRELHARLPQKF